MGDLLDRLDAARAEVLRLERAAAAAPCVERGRHVWKLMGGRNAGCGDGCCCSVPVYSCDCGDCDYGENPEAEAIIEECRRHG